MEVGQFVARLLGVAGLVIGSQGPGFTSQYMQNLSGRVAELTEIVAKYDGIVDRLGISRELYIEDLRAARRETTDETARVIEETYARYDMLVSHLRALDSADPMERPMLLARDFKQDIAEAALERFEWTMPLTPEAAVYGLGSGMMMWGVPAALFRIIGGFFGMGGARRRYR